MHIQAVFIDRDGTLGGSDEVIYPGEFELFPNVIEALQQLKKHNILLCSFTNQPGISKGEATFNSFHKELKGFGFDQIYLCPHQHHEGCECRKPSSGMLRMAAKDNDLDLSRFVVIGDRWTDLIAANEAGCKEILVKTGNGKNDYQKYVNNEFYGSLVNFIIRIYSQSGTICSFVEPFLTTYSTESSDFGNYEIHSVGKKSNPILWRKI